MKIKTDLYTKVVLTVIAVVLTINFVKDITFVSEAKASVPTSFPAPYSTQTDGVIDVNIVQVNGKKLTDDLPVEVKNSSYSPLYITTGYSGLKVQVDNWPYIQEVKGSVSCN